MKIDEVFIEYGVAKAIINGTIVKLHCMDARTTLDVGEGLDIQNYKSATVKHLACNGDGTIEYSENDDFAVGDDVMFNGDEMAYINLSLFNLAFGEMSNG